MAKGAQKRIASTNARAIQTLALGFAITNTLYVIAQLVRYRSVRWPAAVLVPYLLTEAIAVGLAWQLVGMARSGADLAQAGLTAYMFDIVYITWFVHGSTALVSRYFWWTYLVVRGATHTDSPVCTVPALQAYPRAVCAETRPRAAGHTGQGARCQRASTEQAPGQAPGAPGARRHSPAGASCIAIGLLPIL